ncbi:hypothetical protein [Haploplasma axanthum]|uniref:Uncharacterized protein n=1 Tax=Haploplasma axanthum TaxID=29552 RepID=A0A449BD73_HAPAX|nr:hypothetical protein [Haploplasma axanthum]VEU80404.1 Uncharacterised protein [Haploplasma axanthum]
MILTKDEIKNSLEYKEKKRLSLLFGSILVITFLLFLGIFIYLFFVIKDINFEKAILISVLGFMITIIFYIPFSINFYKKIFSKVRKLVKDYNKYEIIEIVLNEPIEEKFNQVRFFISFTDLKENKKELLSSWFPVLKLTEGKVNYESFKGKKALIGYDNDSDEMIMVRILIQ